MVSSGVSIATKVPRQPGTGNVIKKLDIFTLFKMIDYGWFLFTEEKCIIFPVFNPIMLCMRQLLLTNCINVTVE